MKIKNHFIFAILFLLSISFFSCSKPGDFIVQDAMTAYQKQNYERAIELFKKSLTEESNYSNETIFNFIANIYMIQGDFESANEYLEKFLEVKPDYRMLVQLGRNYRELEQNDKAELSYKRAIELEPNKGEAYASIGALKIAEQKYESAIENLKKASEFEPKIAVIHANLAVAYSLFGEKDLAEDEFKIAQELKCENLEEFRERAGL